MKYLSDISHSIRGSDLDFTYKRVHQAAKLIGYEATPQSVTQRDFASAEHRSKHLKKAPETTHDECRSGLRNSTQIEKLPCFEGIDPTLLQNHYKAKSTYGRVTQRVEVASPDHRMKEGDSDVQRNTHNEDSNIADRYFDKSKIQRLQNSEKSLLSFGHQTQNSFERSATKHSDNRKHVDGSKWRFAKTTEANNRNDIKRAHKTIYESDFRHKCGNYCTIGTVPFSNAIGKLSDFQQTHRISCKKANSHYLNKYATREVQQPQTFQYSEPLLFHEKRLPITCRFTQSEHDRKLLRGPDEKCKKDNTKPLTCECPPKEQPQKAAWTLPEWSSRLENIDPNLFRRDDLAKSTQQRVIQGDYTLTSTRKPLSETKESLQKSIDSLPESIKNEKKTKNVEAAKDKNNYLDMIETDFGEFPFTNEAYMKPSDLQRVIFGDPYLGFGPNLESVTASDFRPKIATSQDNGSHSWEPKSPCWMKYRKTRSQFADLDCPKRDGIQKFMDEEDGLFRRLYKR